MSTTALASPLRARALRTRLVQSLLAALAALPASSGAVTYDMVFSATGLNMWGSGSTTVFDHTSFYGGSWSAEAGGGDIESTWIGSFGGQGSVSTSGRVGLEVDIHTQGGGIDLHLPYRVTITPTSDLTTIGRHTLNISSQLNLAPGASAVTTRFPGADFSVRGVLEAQAAIQGELCVFGCIEGGGTIFDFAENFPILSYYRDTDSDTQMISVFGKSHAIGNGFTIPITNSPSIFDTLKSPLPPPSTPLRIRLGTLTVAPPNLDAASTGQSLSTHASQDTLLALQADLLGVASYSLGLPANPFDLRASVLGISFNGTLLSATGGISLGLGQDIAVDPGLGVILHSSVPLSYQTADGGWSEPTQAHVITDLGQPIVIDRDTAGEVAIFPEFFLTPTITNQLDLLFSGTFNIDALQAGISLYGAPLASVGPVWSLHELFSLGAISLHHDSFSVSGAFTGTHIGASLTAAAPQIGDIPANTTHTQPGLVGVFETSRIDGALRLSNGSIYETTVPVTIGAAGELSLLAGAPNEFMTPGLTNLGRITVAPGGTLTISPIDGVAHPDDGFGNLDSSGLLSGGSFDIGGAFSYVGPSITTNSATLSVHGSLQHRLVPDGPLANALATLEANTAAGVLTLGQNLATGLSFTNDGSLTLDNATLTVTTFQQGSAGSLFLNSGAQLVATQADGFLNVGPSGTLSGGDYVIAGQVHYHGPSITTNDATLVLSGHRSTSSPYFSNDSGDALASLSLNTRDLALVNGAELTLDQAFTNQGSIFAASDGYLIVQGAVSNQAGADIEIDDSILSVRSAAGFSNHGTLTISGNGLVHVFGTLGNFSAIDHDSGTAILTGGTWNINGSVSYGSEVHPTAPDIREIGPGTVVNLLGGDGFYNESTDRHALAALAVNRGTLLVSGTTLDTPHALANTGTLVVQNPGGRFGFGHSLSNSGDILVGAGATLSALGSGSHSTAPTWDNVGPDGALSGVGRLFVAGAVAYKGAPITRLASDTDLTLAGAGKFSIRQPDGSFTDSLPIQAIDGALRLSDGAIFHAGDGHHLVVHAGGTLQTGAGTHAVFTGVDLTVQSGATIDNAGILFFDAAGGASRFGVSSGTFTLTGGGGVHFSNDAGNRLAHLGGTLVNQDNVIAGSGLIAADLVNRGTIQSAGGVGLIVAPTLGTLVNSGLIVSGGGVTYADPEDLSTGSFVPSVLTLRDVAIANHEGSTQGHIISGSELRLESSSVTGGKIGANTNGTLVLAHATLDVATFETTTHGQTIVAAGPASSLRADAAYTVFGSRFVLEAGAGLELAGSTAFQNTGAFILHENSVLSGAGRLDNYGTLHVLGAGSATLSAGFANHGAALIDIDQGATLLWSGGTLANAGRIRLGPSGETGVLSIQTSTTLSGGGRIDLGGIVSTGDGPEDRAWAPSGLVQGAVPDVVLTNADHTISGVGRIGDERLLFVNAPAGVVRADKPQGALVIDPAYGFDNLGSLVVENGARLELPETYGPFSHDGALVVGGYGSAAGGTLALAGLRGSLASATIHLADSSARVELGSPGVALDTSYDGSLSGSGTFAKLGDGVTSLRDVSAFTGDFDLQAGTLVLSAAPDAATFTLGDATLRFTTLNVAPASGSALVVAGGEAVIDIPSEIGHVTLAHHSSLGGAGTLVKTGAGTLSIAGVNNFQGLLDIREGTLGNDPLFSGWTIARSEARVSEGATLDLRGQAVTLRRLAGDGSVTNSWTTGTATLSLHGIDGDEVSAFDGSITDGGPGLGATRLELLNAHEVRLRGVNTFTGGVGITHSALFLSGGSALHDHAAVEFPSANDNASLTISDAETIGSLAGNGRVNLDAPLTLGSNHLSTTCTAYLTGAHSLTKTGDGTFTLLKFVWHAPNDYSGGTILQAGAIAFDHDQALGTGPVTLAGGALQPIGARTLANALVVGGDATLGSADSLALSGPVSGSGSLTKTGSGALTLGGATANTFAGQTTVSSGTLVLAKTANVPALSGPVAVHSGGTLVYSGFNSLNAPAAVVTLAGGTLDIRGSGFHGFAGGLDYRSGSLLTPDASAATPVQINLGSDTPGAFTLRGGLSTPASLRLAFTGASPASGVTYDATGDAGLSTIHGPLLLAGAGTFTIADSSAPVDLHVEGAISEAYTSHAFAKTGPGTLRLSGHNTFTGPVTISAGTLRVDGSIASSSLTTVHSGGTLSGTGLVGPTTIRSGGTLAPGASPGLLTFHGPLALDSGSFTVFEIAGLLRGASVGGHDAIDVNGLFTAGGALTVSFSGGYTPAGPATFDLFNFTSFGGSFAQVNLPTVAGHVWNTSNLSLDGTLSLVASAIPEPSAFAVLAGLAAGVSVFSRRRRRA